MWCEKTKHRKFSKFNILCNIILFFPPPLLPYCPSKLMFWIMVLTLPGIPTVPQNSVAIKFSIHCFIIFLLLLPYSPSKSMLWIVVFTALGTLQRLLAQSEKKVTTQGTFRGNEHVRNPLERWSPFTAHACTRLLASSTAPEDHFARKHASWPRT